MLKDYLKNVKKVTVSKEVTTKLEVAQFLSKNDEIVLFEKVKGYSNWKIVGNVCSSRKTFANILGCSTESLVETLSEALTNPKKYSVVRKAGFLKNEFKNPDILKLIPLVMYYAEKERLYSSATIILVRDPDSGLQNASFHRMMYLDKNRFAVRILPRDLFNIFKKNQQRGKDTDVIVICGVHPAICLAAASSYPNLNELELANSILNNNLKCIAVNGIDVPVDSEVVMVGRILSNEVADEGPFVDITGTWDNIRKQPVFVVDKLYLQDNPIWQVILPGWTEHRVLMGIPQEPRILTIVRNAVPSAKDVFLTEGGVCWLHAVVSIKKRHEGEGKNAGMAALSAHPSLKMAIIVDDDIDVRDSKMVEWALATRLKPDEGVFFVKGARGSSLDPSSAGTGVTTKWVIDATIPMDRDKRDFKRVEMDWT